MRPAVRVAGTVLDEVAAFIQPGVTTAEVDEFAAARIKQLRSARARFWGIGNIRATFAFRSMTRWFMGWRATAQLQFGDIVSVDVGVIYNGFIGDTARTVAVGGCGVLAQRLMDVTEKALYEGIAQAVPGNRVADISRAIQTLRRRQRFQRGAGVCRPRRRPFHARRAAGAELCGYGSSRPSCGRA